MMNFKDAQLGLPGRKHFWASKLVNHTRDLNNLKVRKKDLVDKVAKAIIEQSPTIMPFKQAQFKAYNHTSIIKIEEQIVEVELLVDLLSRASDIFKSMTWDIKNITRIIELETM